MSQKTRVINLRITFIGAVEHIRQIECGLASHMGGLDDVEWIESVEEGVVHLDASFKDVNGWGDEVDTARQLFESIPRYFNQRSYIVDDGPVNRVGLDNIDSLPTGWSRCGYDIIPINNIGQLITDHYGVERHRAVVSMGQWPARLCKLDKTYPA